MKKLFLTLLLPATLLTSIKAQDKYAQNKKQNIDAYFGIGAGFDYGGIGLKAEFIPIQKLGIFLGFGYNFTDPAFNAGLSFKTMPEKKVCPVIVAMYGYNASIKIKNIFGTIISSKTYYGVTVGGGTNIKYGTKNNKVSLCLLVPFRNATFKRDYKNWEDAGSEFKPGILPIAFSVGCNFAIQKKALQNTGQSSKNNITF